MPDHLWREQVAYYRRRADEYDATAYGDLPDADERLAALVDRLRPSGDVLEVACGTGSSSSSGTRANSPTASAGWAGRRTSGPCRRAGWSARRPSAD
jgi:hypothetical protein